MNNLTVNNLLNGERLNISDQEQGKDVHSYYFYLMFYCIIKCA